MAGVDVQFTPRICDSGSREPGLVLFTCRPGSIRNQKAQLGWVIAIDQNGQRILEYQSPAATQDVRYHPGGTIFYSQSGAGLLFEIDFSGRELRRWHARGRWQGKVPPSKSIELPIEVLHHTFTFMPNGNFLLLSAEVRTYDDWFTSTTDKNAPRARASIVGDVICEVTPEGRLVNEWRLLDLLDPYRISHGSLSSYWHKQGFPGAHDWCHTNAVAYHPADDCLMVSLRHQDCIVKFEYGSGKLRWILGNHGNWSDRFRGLLLEPGDGLEWQFHQHDCSFLGPEQVLCFDNGNFRAPAFVNSMPDEDSYSRVVEYTIDPEKRRIRQSWCFGEMEGEKIFACYQGGALRMRETGNTFMTFGGICFKDGKPTKDNGEAATGFARLIEATPQGKVVFDMLIDARAGPSSTAFSAFRADHVPVGALLVGI